MSAPAGIGLYYSDDIHGVPAVLVQTVMRMPVVYEVNIFMTNRPVPVPEVIEKERLLVEQLGVTGFYHIIARYAVLPPVPCIGAALTSQSWTLTLMHLRYGYAEKIDQGETFLLAILERLLALLLRALEEELVICPSLRTRLGLPDIFNDEVFTAVL